jgi:hypothetical protein
MRRKRAWAVSHCKSFTRRSKTNAVAGEEKAAMKKAMAAKGQK